MKAIDLANLILSLSEEEQQLQVGSMFNTEYGTHLQIDGIEIRESNVGIEKYDDFMDDADLGDKFVNIK